MNTTVDSSNFVRFRSKLIGVRSEKNFDDDWSVLFSNLIGELRFPTDRLTERLNTNFNTNSGNFARLLPKSVGRFFRRWSESSTLPIDRRNIKKKKKPSHPVKALVKFFFFSSCFFIFPTSLDKSSSLAPPNRIS